MKWGWSGTMLVLACFAALCDGACSNGPNLGFAVALTLDFDPSISDASLADITSLSIRTSGNETYAKTISLGRHVARTEGLVYRPDSTSLAIDIVVDALAADGTVIAHGDTGSLRLHAGKTLSVELSLAAAGTNDFGPDVRMDDMQSDKYRAAILSDHPVAYYRLDETQGTTAVDSSGNKHAGTYFGAYTFGQPGALGGDSDTAVRFTPDVGGISVNDTLLDTSSNNPWSVETWVSPTSISSTGGFIWSLAATDAKGTEWMHAFVSSKLGLQVERRTADGSNLANDAPAPPIGMFTHFVVTYDGSSVTLYENGLFASTFTDTIAADQLLAPFYIGTESSTDGTFNGALDEVAIYDYALSPTQIKAHHDAGTGQ